MYDNILVGFDNSEYSKAALNEVKAWVKAHGGKAVLVHAVYFDEEEFGIAPVMLEKRIEMGKKVCYQERETALAGDGLDIETVVCEGEPHDVILDVAKAKGCDLIAMGTHGRKGLKRLLMGSVTTSVVVDSPSDVLIVKRPCGGCDGKYHSILVPFDGSEFSKKALERACGLSAQDGSTVTVLYVIPRYEEMVEFLRTSSIRKSLFDEAEKILGQAKALASANGVTVITESQEGNAAEKAVEVAGMLKCDLIVMGGYGWRGVNKAIIGSTTERVIMSARCPVLIVR